MRSIKWSSVGVNLTVILLVIIWTVPTLGLFITSFRDKEAISNSGWWTVFTNPQGAFTLDNYEKVLFGGDGLATAFLNTLAVTVPAVVIPITIALLAAYAFACNLNATATLQVGDGTDGTVYDDFGDSRGDHTHQGDLRLSTSFCHSMTPSVINRGK